MTEKDCTIDNGVCEKNKKNIELISRNFALQKCPIRKFLLIGQQTVGYPADPKEEN